jgi:hypothetical protein
MADIYDSSNHVSVLKSVAVDVGINACILADGNLSFVVKDKQGQAVAVLSAEAARPVAEIILRAAALK